MSAASSPEQSTASTPDRPRVPSVARWGALWRLSRCDRLYKNCTEQVHKPRKRHDSKTKQLEERLNRLVTSLRVSGNVSGLPKHPEGNLPKRPLVVPNHDTTLPPGHPDFLTQCRSSPWQPSSNIDAGPVQIPEIYNCFVPPTCICRAEPGEAPGPPDTDDNLLAIYRDEMAPHFPFVIIPAGVTASTLNATRPFLMASIRMVASIRSPRSMRGQMYRLLSYIADHMVLRSERSMDLLLGLVVILGWFHHHCIAHAQFDMLVSQAACLVGELGLKRGPSLTERTRLIVMRPCELKQRTNEERRLLLAVWYLSSSVSLDVQQIDPMRFSAYMEQCLRELEETMEYESDIHVIYIVRVQRLAERISQIRANEDWDGGLGLPKAPISAYASSFQAELDKLVDNMPPSLEDKWKSSESLLTEFHADQRPDFLKVQMATARLRLCEPPKIDAELLASLSNSLKSLTSGHNSALDIFYQANTALKAWFDAWLAIPISAFYPCPLPMALQLIYAVVMMSRWAWLAASNSEPSKLAPVDDPSSDNPNVALAAMEAAINPNTPVSISTPSTSAKSPSRDPSAPEKNLPQVLAELRALLSRQPALMIDVADILNKVATQLEEVDATMAAVSADSGPWRGNIYTLGATKVRIAQIRQRRWSEMVSKGQEEEDEGDEASEEDGMGEVEMQGNVPANFSTMGGWGYDMAWGPDVYDIVDPSLFIDGMGGVTEDWAGVGFTGMASAEQLGGTHIPGQRYV
ncbi:C6 transcription factor [Colletotrichum kahawae]|uniref:C6 transcription factor n=1 Tax=Colletotrichum kahawae TaxID=34407 RepID=A0AAD9YDB6_COLKA|nr:C6 transcription factor [Colletotrichum kahawae]